MSFEIKILKDKKANQIHLNQRNLLLCVCIHEQIYVCVRGCDSTGKNVPADTAAFPPVFD